MRIKELMQEKGVQQQQMAEFLNVSRATIYKYQQGKAEPNIKTLIELADYFDVSLDYLCGRQNKNLIFADSLSKNKKELINLIKDLDDDSTLIALGFVAKLANKPIDDVLQKIK